MSDKLDTRVIQVTNIAPSVTKDQMKTLFNYLGRIDEIKLYPSERSETQVGTRVCYVKYDDTTSVGVALHLSNTVFIDRALIIVPVMDGKIPDEQTALQMAPSAVAGMIPGQPTWPSNVISQLQGTGLHQEITTNDPRLTALGLPQYPPLPGSTDPSKIEEIRRTVYISNLNPEVTGQQILGFFSQVGEIKYVRMGGEGVGEARCAYVEFSDQRSVATALTYNGVMFSGTPIRVSHSLSSIIKPKSESQKAAQREIDEAMKKVREAQSLITAAADSGDLNIDKAVSRLASGFGRSRSRSGSRYRSRSKRSRSRRRSRSHRRSRSRRRSRSASRKKSKSVSPPKRKLGPGMPPLPGTIKKRENRSRSRHRRSRSRSPRRRRSRSRRRSRTPSSYKRRSRRSRSRSKTSRRRSRSRKRSRSRDRKRSRSRDRKRSRSRDRKRTRTRSKSPVKKKSRSRSLSIPKLKRADSESSSSPPPETKPKSPKKSSSGQSRSRSRTPVKKSSRRSRSRSRSRGRRGGKKSSRRSRSRSTERRKRSRSRKKSRSRSGSRHRSSRKEKKRDRDRDRSGDRSHDRDREKEKSKKKHKEKEKEREEKKDSKVKRDYDEEEMNLYDDLDRQYKEEEKAAPIQTIITEKPDDSDLQQVDMDMSD